MGDDLARAADAIHKEWVMASPAYQRSHAPEVRSVPMDTETFAELMGAHVAGLRQAVLFLAEQMEDPEDADIGEVILESLRRTVATESDD